jgi:hypothetical protein
MRNKHLCSNSVCTAAAVAAPQSLLLLVTVLTCAAITAAAQLCNNSHCTQQQLYIDRDEAALSPANHAVVIRLQAVQDSDERSHSFPRDGSNSGSSERGGASLFSRVLR